MARTKRDEAEIQATINALPLEPSADVIEKVKKTCLKDGVLIYRAAKWTDPETAAKLSAALKAFGASL